MSRVRAYVLGPSDPWTTAVLVLAGLVVTGGLVGSMVWLAGCTAAMAVGRGFGPTPATALTLLLQGGDLAAIWPGVPYWLIVQLGSLLGLLLGYLGWNAASMWVVRHPPVEGFAGPAQLADLLPGRAGRSRALRLRPGLVTAASADLGVPLGRLGPRGPLLRATWEDVVLAICAPRSGKTTCLAIPAVLDAPGAVVATSNKADLWAHTNELRSRDTGQAVWNFDPQEITGTDQTFYWDPLDGVTTVAAARRLAGHFIQEVRRDTDRGDFWDRDAEDLLTALLLAAGLERAPIGQVARWLASPSSVAPRTILSTHGFAELADSLSGRAHGAQETREGVYATARAATACLSDPQITAWITPRAALPALVPESFVRSRQTLYLLSKDGAGSAAPIVAAFADRLMHESVRAAELLPGGRLDPPLVAVLDEAANVCRIPELPRLYSHLGSRGVVPITILQSRAQGRRVWGQGGMDELFSAATIKLIGAGIDDPTFADEMSRLIGDHDVIVPTRTSGWTTNTSRTTRRQRIVPADQVRSLTKFTALLLITGVRPARIRLAPWMAGPRAAEIQTHSPRT